MKNIILLLIISCVTFFLIGLAVEICGLINRNNTTQNDRLRELIVSSLGIIFAVLAIPQIKIDVVIRGNHILSALEISFAFFLLGRVLILVAWLLSFFFRKENPVLLSRFSMMIFYLIFGTCIGSLTKAYLEFDWTWREYDQSVPILTTYLWLINELFVLCVLSSFLSYIRRTANMITLANGHIHEVMNIIPELRTIIKFKNKKKKIGEYAVDRGFMTKKQLETCINLQNEDLNE